MRVASVHSRVDSVLSATTKQITPRLQACWIAELISWSSVGDVYWRACVCVCLSSSDNKRRTRYVQSTCDPEWHQTLVFINFTRQHLVSQTLELTVWDYDRFKTHEFLGEVNLNMSGKRRAVSTFSFWLYVNWS